jgi:pimeloyl-ACP methyl ester carboxylesterase
MRTSTTGAATGGNGREVTLMIHGTFAGEENWWRPGGGRHRTAADHLEDELARRGRPGTVWAPVHDAGMTSEQFRWSGANSHTARVEAAESLRRNLDELARRHRCSAERPLAVNLVAHSHGGNVALEAIKRLPEAVRVRRLVMLGTPMVWRRLSLRPLVLFWAMVALLTLANVVGATVAEVSGADAATMTLVDPMVALGRAVLTAALAAWMIYGISRIYSVGYEWIRHALRWRCRGTPAYGPSARRLAATLGRPAYLLRTREDEADLLLHVGAAPKLFYNELVTGRFHGWKHWAELTLLRPWVYVAAAPLVEMALEKYVLGFRWRQVLVRDHEMVSFRQEKDWYPADVVVRVDVTNDLLPALTEKLRERRPPIEMMSPPGMNGNGERHAEALRSTVSSVARNLVGQVRLRHSLYYESDEVIGRVADLIAGEVEVSHPAPLLVAASV